MAVFPKIDSPCPYKNGLAAVMDGDFCRLCRRTVFDLSPMSDDERVAFLSGCTEKVCVSYALPLRPAIAAAAMAAAMALPSAAAAQEADVAIDVEAGMEISPDVEEMTIFVGGITNPAAAEMTEDPADANVPELPVVYEEEPAQRPEAAEPARKPLSPSDGV